MTGTSCLKKQAISVDNTTEAIHKAKYCKMPGHELFEISGNDVNLYPVI